MAALNKLDYLRWRGDLAFSADCFNEVDGSILAMLSYIDYNKFWGKDDVVFKRAVESYCPDKKYDSVKLGLILPSKKINELFCSAAKTRRFGLVRASDYKAKTSIEENCQFAAVTFHLPNHRAVIAFRGTDDSLVGWREDCYLSFCEEIPAQRMAVEYLEMIAEKYPDERLYTVGHSKGGNLALYSAVKCSERTRAQLIRAYSYDGPGFSKTFVSSDEYKAAHRKLVAIVPQSSFVGTMFDVGGHYTVVNGTVRGPLQHDSFTWEVEGSSFKRLPALSERGQKNAKQFNESMERMSEDEKREFVETLFSIVESTGAKTLTDFSNGKFKSVGALIKNYNGMDKEKKELMLGLFLKLFDFKKQIEK